MKLNRPTTGYAGTHYGAISVYLQLVEANYKIEVWLNLAQTTTMLVTFVIATKATDAEINSEVRKQLSELFRSITEKLLKGQE